MTHDPTGHAPHACGAWSLACTRDSAGREVAGAAPHVHAGPRSRGISIETRAALAGLVIMLAAVVAVFLIAAAGA